MPVPTPHLLPVPVPVPVRVRVAASVLLLLALLWQRVLGVMRGWWRSWRGWTTRACRRAWRAPCQTTGCSRHALPRLIACKQCSTSKTGRYVWCCVCAVCALWVRVWVRVWVWAWGRPCPPATRSTQPPGNGWAKPTRRAAVEGRPHPVTVRPTGTRPGICVQPVSSEQRAHDHGQAAACVAACGAAACLVRSALLWLGLVVGGGWCVVGGW